MEELITGLETRNHKAGCFRHCRRGAIFHLPDHLKLITLRKPQPQIKVGRPAAFSCCECPKYTTLKDFSPESAPDAAAGVKGDYASALYL